MKLSVSARVPSVEERSSDSSEDERERGGENQAQRRWQWQQFNLLIAALDLQESWNIGKLDLEFLCCTASSGQSFAPPIMYFSSWL